MKIPTIQSVTVLDDGDDQIVSVYIDFDSRSDMEIGASTICLVAIREHVECAFAHPVDSRCKKCGPDKRNRPSPTRWIA